MEFSGLVLRMVGCIGCRMVKTTLSCLATLLLASGGAAGQRHEGEIQDLIRQLREGNAE